MAAIALAGLYIQIKLADRVSGHLLKKVERIFAKRAHIIPLIPKYQISLAFVAFAIVALEFMYLLLGLPLPTMEGRAILAIVGATSLAYLVWYSLRWRT